MDDIKDVAVGSVEGEPRLRVTFTDGRVLDAPLSDQVALVLNAGGWMVREHLARQFEADLGGENPVSRRIRSSGGQPAPSTRA